MTVFRDSGEFGPALRSTAEGLGIPAAAVEKDYWISEILRALSQDFGRDFVFKGGTSLSKAHRIVERFSEDVDILVLPGGRGRGAVDKLMKAMGALGAKTTGGEAHRYGDAESGKHRAYEINYPAINIPARPLSATAVQIRAPRPFSGDNQSDGCRSTRRSVDWPIGAPGGPRGPRSAPPCPSNRVPSAARASIRAGD
jgi:hypothetical protein